MTTETQTYLHTYIYTCDTIHRLSSARDCPVDWCCRIHRMHFFRGVKTLPTCFLDIRINKLM